MAYEQGWQKFQGVRFHFGWPDEEPPEDIWSQMLRGTISQKNSRIAMTMTPEEGMTKVVTGFMNELKHGQACVTATWDDAKHNDTSKEHKVGDTHLTTAKKKQILAALPEWQRDMRSKGIPLMGSGLVFPIREEDIVIDPIEIPSYWRRICGIDFGIDHPFGSAWVAHDSENDVVHIYSDYAQRGATPPVHASAIKSRGEWIPIAWPHDGLAKDKGSGIPLADLYRKEGLNLLREKFSNPPGPNQDEGQGGQGVEVGIVEMWNRMETGRLKVHRTCTNWLSEFRQYHRKDGQIVKIKDDCISASRYAIQSLRFAYTRPIIRPKVVQLRGATNW
jgi:phage terminase large subunit-like protein